VFPIQGWGQGRRKASVGVGPLVAGTSEAGRARVSGPRSGEENSMEAHNAGFRIKVKTGPKDNAYRSN